MQSLSLYNLLVGFFTHESVNPVDVDRSYYERLTEEDKIRKSIIENLTTILGTRQGSISHLPDFGMPDIMKTFVDAGYTYEPFKRQIRDTILKYEPRIASVRMEDPHFDKNTMRLFLKIFVTVRDFSQTEILLTEFSTTGWMKVTSEKDRP